MVDEQRRCRRRKESRDRMVASRARKILRCEQADNRQGAPACGRERLSRAGTSGCAAVMASLRSPIQNHTRLSLAASRTTSERQRRNRAITHIEEPDQLWTSTPRSHASNYRAKLLIIEPLAAFLAGPDANKDQEIRRVLYNCLRPICISANPVQTASRVRLGGAMSDRRAQETARRPPF
jgi:hypothetical protein